MVGWMEGGTGKYIEAGAVLVFELELISVLVRGIHTGSSRFHGSIATTACGVFHAKICA